MATTTSIQLPIYFDSAATTPLHPEVAEALCRHLTLASNQFANPASAHRYGHLAKQQLRQNRMATAELLGCDADEVIFTSGATEANNLALTGIMRANRHHGTHLITVTTEHKAVLACCDALEAEGFSLTYLQVDGSGLIDIAELKSALRPETLLISVMAVNNETGVMQPLTEIAAIAARAGVLFHVDAAQSVGKFALNLADIAVDLLSISAHKFYGPKGVGALIVRQRRHLRLQPLCYGGGQEFGLRPGTVPTHQISALVAALQRCQRQRESELAHIRTLQQRFMAWASSQRSVQIHSPLSGGSPYIINFSVAGYDSDALLNQCEAVAAFSSGSACSSGTIEPSHVLRGMGITARELYGAVRISFGYYNTLAEIDYFIHHLEQLIEKVNDAR
ncbi:cysteine desulfurase [Ectothiorhodospiraceae bacterium BW-2]|nr:cysteine desulfurase [Ectothiorhodospiraceae bacterium BW-2]